jgi:hypothetical protein
MVPPANECLSKVIFFGDRSSHRMTKSHTERNHQGNSTISCCGRLRIRAAKKRHDPASGGVNPCVLTDKTRREQEHKLDRGKVALGPPPCADDRCLARSDSRALAAAARTNTINRFFIKNGNGDAATRLT